MHQLFINQKAISNKSDKSTGKSDKRSPRCIDPLFSSRICCQIASDSEEGVPGVIYMILMGAGVCHEFLPRNDFITLEVQVMTVLLSNTHLSWGWGRSRAPEQQSLIVDKWQFGLAPIGSSNPTWWPLSGGRHLNSREIDDVIRRSTSPSVKS